MARFGHSLNRVGKRDLIYKDMEKNPTSNRPIDHDKRGTRTPEACQAAIEQKGIKEGTRVILDGETIPRPVASIIMPGYKLELFGAMAPAYPTEVTVVR